MLTIRNCLAVATAIALLLAFTWFASAPAVAQECVSVEQFFEGSDEFEDFAVVGGAQYDGAVTDMTVVYTAAGKVWLAGFKAGCLKVGPLALDDISATPEPQSAPMAPALRNPKIEAGA